VVERAMIFADGTQLEVGDLPELGTIEPEAAAAETIDGNAFGISKGLTLSDAEKEYIQHTLDACDGSVQRAAESLGISRKNLWEKRKKYGLLD
jgi:DNA-binding NtrC family response regulator